VRRLNDLLVLLIIGIGALNSRDSFYKACNLLNLNKDEIEKNDDKSKVLLLKCAISFYGKNNDTTTKGVLTDSIREAFNAKISVGAQNFLEYLLQNNNQNYHFQDNRPNGENEIENKFNSFISELSDGTECQ